jgi:hypothetical protein
LWRSASSFFLVLILEIRSFSSFVNFENNSSPFGFIYRKKLVSEIKHGLIL